MTQESARRWVEFAGGPADGLMTELSADFVLAEGAGMVLYEKPTDRPAGARAEWRNRGPARGRYIVDGSVDEDLGIARMRWTHDVPPDMR